MTGLSNVTLKKKYKVENLKSPPSKWPFFYRLEELIGPSSATVGTKKSKRSSVLEKAKAKEVVGYSINTRMRMEDSSGSDESEEFGGGREEVEEEDVAVSGRKARMDYVDFTEESAYKELARAILRFGEVYERIESSKQQQMMELEKQRMEFTKELEVQRMNMFLDTQLEHEKMKRMRNDRSNGAADVLLWRNKKISASVISGFTAVWVLFEWLNYHFLQLFCFAVIIGMLGQFALSNASAILNSCIVYASPAVNHFKSFGCQGHNQKCCNHEGVYCTSCQSLSEQDHAFSEKQIFMYN